jgi:hypothetical protein
MTGEFILGTPKLKSVFSKEADRCAPFENRPGASVGCEEEVHHLVGWRAILGS